MAYFMATAFTHGPTDRSTSGNTRMFYSMAKAPTSMSMEQSTLGNGRMIRSGMESSTAPMEQLKEPIQTLNGFPNSQPDIAAKAERFTVKC